MLSSVQATLTSRSATPSAKLGLPSPTRPLPGSVSCYNRMLASALPSQLPPPTTRALRALRRAMDRAQEGVVERTKGFFEIKLKEKALFGKNTDDVLEAWAGAHYEAV